MTTTKIGSFVFITSLSYLLRGQCIDLGQHQFKDQRKKTKNLFVILSFCQKKKRETKSRTGWLIKMELLLFRSGYEESRRVVAAYVSVPGATVEAKVK